MSYVNPQESPRPDGILQFGIPLSAYQAILEGGIQTPPTDEMVVPKQRIQLGRVGALVVELCGNYIVLPQVDETSAGKSNRDNSHEVEIRYPSIIGDISVTDSRRPNEEPTIYADGLLTAKSVLPEHSFRGMGQGTGENVRLAVWPTPFSEPAGTELPS